MQCIPISLALPEMVVARPVQNPSNPDGFPLCGPGTVLSASLIERLAERGVGSVTVVGHPVSVPGEPTLEELLSALEQRFEGTASDHRMQWLKGLYRERLIRSREEGE